MAAPKSGSLLQMKGRAVIPAKSNARKPVPHDTNLYAMRNIVERFFCKMKDMRRLVMRFEK